MFFYFCLYFVKIYFDIFKGIGFLTNSSVEREMCLYFTLRYVFVTDIIDTLILSHCFSSSSSKMTSQDF